MTLVIFLALIVLSFISCSNDEISSNYANKIDIDLFRALKENSPTLSLSYFKLPDSEDFHSIPQDPKNPITKEKIALGAFLFHETGLAVDAKDQNLKGSFSCASCHHAAAGFQAGNLQGIGEGGSGFGVKGELRNAMPHILDHDVQPIRTPSAMNGAYQKNQLWNGQFGATHLNENTKSNWAYGTPIEVNFLGYEGLETQAIAGLSVHRLNIDQSILEIPSYKRLFDEAFPKIELTKRYTKEYAGLAIAAYERTVLSYMAPFQKYLKGYVNAMSNSEKNGAILFFTKAKCVQCHTGPALNSMQFNALGMKDLLDCTEATLKTKTNDPTNLGRGGFTKNVNDNYKFKVPQLYNLSDVGFFGHGSSFRSIKEVVNYKNKAVPENKLVDDKYLDVNFVPLSLTDNEVNEIVQFLSISLRDPRLTSYVPNDLPSGNCFPNADAQSKKDLNCK
jgi:cytochrome c peroxidase